MDVPSHPTPAGEDLKLTSHSSELAAVLLRDRPGASLEAQQELGMGMVNGVYLLT